jgi:hypothetical protein
MICENVDIRHRLWAVSPRHWGVFVYVQDGIALQERPRLSEKGALLHKGGHLRHLDTWPAQLACHCRCVVGARSGRLSREC